MAEIRLCDSGELDLTANLCMENGLGIEVQTFHDPNLTDIEEQLKKHKEILVNIPGGKSFHAPFWDLNIGSKISGIRQVTMDVLNASYKTAKELGCTEIVVHNGYYPGTYFEDAWVNRAVEFWKEFFSDKDDSITICIENQFELDSSIFIKEIDALGDPRLKHCLDVGHAHANSNMSVEEWITSLGSRIGYLHLHNNHGKQNIPGHNNDEHLGLANGTINMERVFELASIYCPEAILNIETGPEYLLESVNWLQERGYMQSREQKKL